MSAAAPSQRHPVIELATAHPELILRASVCQKGVVFASLVRIASDAPVLILAHHSQDVRPAAQDSLQIGGTVLLLAPGEAERYFTWLRTGSTEATGAH